MDYQRVYNQFIKDRKCTEPELLASGDYVEVHHVVPRSLGGSDERDNLIALTADDHYFAHLLLAKIHGGRLASALFLMSSRADSSRVTRSSYAAAKKQWSEFNRGKPGNKGSDNGRYDDTPRRWINLDTGDEEVSTTWDMWCKYGGPRATWTTIRTGNDSNKRTCRGWAVAEYAGNVNRGLKGKRHNFLNRDGRVFRGTQKEFCDTHNINFASASRVCRHGDVTKCGWRLEGTLDRKHYIGRDGKYPRQDKGILYVIERGDERHVVKRQEAASIIGSTLQQFSAGANLAIKNGTLYKGWKIDKA